MEVETILYKKRPRPKRNRIKKSKKNPYKAKAITEAKRVVRLKGFCERCGEKEWLQGAHIIPLSSSSLVGADLENLLCLCYRCHLNWWHKHPMEVRPWFDKKWPGRYQMLETLVAKRRNNKPTPDWWQRQYEALTKNATQPIF